MYEWLLIEKLFLSFLFHLRKKFLKGSFGHAVEKNFYPNNC